MIHYFYLFAGQTGAYVILGLNIRALAKGKLLLTGVTEFFYGLIAFFMIRYVATAQTSSEAMAYAAGATVGCLISIWMTKHWEAA